MEKSYSDFAKELGVSKQKLNYYVNDENKEKIFIKKGNKNYVTEFGQEYLYKKTKDKNEKKESEKKEKNFEVFFDSIKEKDKQIDKLHQLLDQQQRLSLQDKKLLEEYKTELSNLKALKMPEEELNIGIDQIKKELEKANDEIDQNQAKLAEKDKQIEKDEKINKEWSESNKELEKENESLKMELQKVQSKKWFQFWK